MRFFYAYINERTKTDTMKSGILLQIIIRRTHVRWANYIRFCYRINLAQDDTCNVLLEAGVTMLF